MTLCIKCFKYEKQFTITKKKVTKIKHSHPRDVKFIICSECLQSRLSRPNIKDNLWEIDKDGLLKSRQEVNLPQA